MLFLQILFIVSLLSGLVMLVYSKKPKEQRTGEYLNESVVHIKELFPVDKIYDGLIYSGDQCFLLAKVEGVNFSVMSESEQNSREAGMIDIFARIDYPIKFITNTIVVDTTVEAGKIAEVASNSPESNLKTYRIMYAGALELMRTERSVLAQQSYLVIPGATDEEAKGRLKIIASSLSNTSVIITPIRSTDEVFNTIQDILLPEKITRPADVAQEGVTFGLHFNRREFSNA